jgi:hypothetical protein
MIEDYCDETGEVTQMKFNFTTEDMVALSLVLNIDLDDFLEDATKANY